MCSSDCQSDSATVGQFKRLEVRLEEVLKYENNRVVRRIMHHKNLSVSEAEMLFRDMLCFLWLGHAAKTSLCPPPRIDVAWHTFLLFTSDYRGFCGQYFGYFIDHNPSDPEDKIDNKAMVSHTLQQAKHFLGLEGIKLSENWDFEKAIAPAGQDGRASGSCQSSDGPSA